MWELTALPNDFPLFGELDSSIHGSIIPIALFCYSSPSVDLDQMPSLLWHVDDPLVWVFSLQGPHIAHWYVPVLTGVEYPTPQFRRFSV